MHRYSLSSFSLRPAVPARRLAPRVPFSARSFLVHGETSAAAARRWTAAGTPLLVRGRCSPSEVLPRLPITRASFCLSHSSPRLSVFRPLRAAVAPFPSIVVLPPSVFLSPSLVTVLLHAPVFILSPAPLLPAPLSLGYDLLHPVVLVPATSYIPSSVLAHSTFPSQLLSFRSY